MEKNIIDAADEFGDLIEASLSGQIFKEFKPKDVVASRFINDLVENGYRKKKSVRRKIVDEEGLYMSDELQDVGVMSIAPSLSALLLELSLLKDKGEAGYEGITFGDMLKNDGGKVLGVVKKSVCKLLSECMPEEVNDYAPVLLSSMPFYDELTASDGTSWLDNGYLDSASWVFLAADSIERFLNRLERVAPELYDKDWNITQIDDKGKEFVKESLTAERVRKAVRKIYLACLRITCDCIVRRDGEVVGWTFRHMDGDAEPSLYFSYVASTVYLGLYKRFNVTDKAIDTLRDFEGVLKNSGDHGKSQFKFYENFSSPEKLAATLDRLESYAAESKDRGAEKNPYDAFADFLKQLDAFALSELDFLYNTVNNGQPLSYKIDRGKDDGAFSLLKDATVALAKRLWTVGFGNSKTRLPFRENMAKGPCFENGELVNMETVRLSNQNNAFFNNLFVIGIVLNSAYDAELADTDPKEYDTLLNTFQLSIQNTQRCYNEIESYDMLYKIDSYILDFSDKVDAKNAELAKQLRKVNMSVVPLLPLMLKNNNLMSEYVVKYPQKQMIDSLKDIIRNRKRGQNGPCWVWDKDGYNAITNYYYVDALIAFYRYYETYEMPFVGNEKDRREREQIAADAAELRRVTELKQLEAEKQKQIDKLSSYAADVRNIGKGVARLVINGLIDIVDEQLGGDTLLDALDEDDLMHTAKVVAKLKSFTSDDDIVKLTKLVGVFDKLQLMSMLMLSDVDDDVLAKFFGTAGEGGMKTHSYIIRDVLGSDKMREKFLLRLLKTLIPTTLKDDGDKDGDKATDD